MKQHQKATYGMEHGADIPLPPRWLRQIIDERVESFWEDFRRSAVLLNEAGQGPLPANRSHRRNGCQRRLNELSGMWATLPQAVTLALQMNDEGTPLKHYTHDNTRRTI